MDDKTRIMTGRRNVARDGQQSEPDDRTRFAPRVEKDLTLRPDATRIKNSPDIKPFINDASLPSGFPADTTRLKSSLVDADPSSASITKALDGLIKAAESKSPYGSLKGRFVFEEVLGSGGMGVVYKAKDLLKVEAQDREPYVAIKVLSDEFKAHPEAFIALQRESRKTQRMAHPNIVNVHDFDRDGDTVFMTMEYMEGTPLDKLISQYRSIGLPRDTVWQILEDACAALIYAHEQNVIHSDFKPGNIFVTNSGTAKVFDFGIARAVAKAEHFEESVDDRTVFDAGSLGALTPAYASLEMLQGETPDVRDDIYALGCIAYELFTGDHPYNRMHADEAQRQGVKAKRISGITRKQWRAIERAIAFRRDNRCESVEEFWRELTVKPSQSMKIRAGAIVVVALIAFLFYQLLPESGSGMSEDQFRSEIERNLRVEMKKDTINALYTRAEFTAGWERDLWNDVLELRQILGASDEWLMTMEKKLFQLYLQTVSEYIGSGQLERAEELLENALRYGNDRLATDELISQIEAVRLAREREKAEQRQRELAQAEERRRAAVRAEAEARINSEFDQAMTNIRRQTQCHGNINMNDFAIALDKLKAINPSRYAREEGNVARALANCIESIGEAFPERAEAAKRDAMALFTRNATIAAIKIKPRDPCNLSLAGKGSQSRVSTCRDHMPGVQHPPIMVVVPPAAGMPAFAIGQTEVTFQQINEFCALSENCEALPSTSPNLPAHNIPVATANEYLKWLSEESGYRYRLPSRPEWQYAASANGSRVDSNRNCRLNSRGISKGDSLVRVSVGQKNNWGLINHLGNAQEWVSDRGGRLVAVGGSYETPMEQCDSSFSVPHSGQPDAITGFRVLRELSGQQ